MVAKRSKKSGTFDKEILVLITVIFIVGIVLGFFFGKKSSQDEIVPPKKKTVVSKKASPKKLAKPELSQRAPKVAIVIDDVGNDDHFKELVWNLPAQVTIAVLPGLPYSKYYATEGKRRGFEIILHQPMEPIRRMNDEDFGMIRVDTSDAEIVRLLDQNLSWVPGAIGFNNHMGSLGTQDSRVMNTVLQYAKRNRLLFLDSQTSSRSVASEIARKLGIKILIRDVFLDNELEPDYIHGQFEQLEEAAIQNGYAIGIGHYKFNTLTILNDELVKLKEKGFRIVSLQDLL